MSLFIAFGRKKCWRSVPHTKNLSPLYRFLPHFTAFYRFLPHLTAFYRFLPILTDWGFVCRSTNGKRTANERITDGKRSCGQVRRWGMGGVGEWGEWVRREGRDRMEEEWRQSEATAKLQRSYGEGRAVEKKVAKKVNILKKICTFAIWYLRGQFGFFAWD